jgi:hypothetical protein
MHRTVSLQVYLLSADVCAAADNMAELLKCLQQLVNNIYPALEQQQQQQQQVQHPAASIQHQLHQQAQQQDRSEQHQQQRQHQDSSNSRTKQDSSRFESAWSDTSSDDSNPDSSSSCIERLPEVAAALLLYFVCVPLQPVIKEITKQLRAASKPRPGSCRRHTSTATATAEAATEAAAAVLPAPEALISSPLYRQAVLDTAAALRCNWCTFLGSYFGQSHPLLVRAVMSHHVERMRVQAVRKLVSRVSCGQMLRPAAYPAGLPGGKQPGQWVYSTRHITQVSWKMLFRVACSQSVACGLCTAMGHWSKPMFLCLLHAQGVAYRMLPSAVFQRWLQLGCSSSSSRLGGDRSRDGTAQELAAGAGVAAAGSFVSQDSVGCITEVLKKAAENGSKAAGIAASRFAGQGEPLDTLYFRAS